jgi:PAS domain S-box-containing protein
VWSLLCVVDISVSLVLIDTITHMTHENHIVSRNPDVSLASLFEAVPGSCVLLGIDAPHFTILAATAEYLMQAGTTREAIMGKGIFQAFPGNPDDVSDTGTNNLKASLEYVLQHKKAHRLPLQRYDVADENGIFSEKYWRASNKPVFSTGGDITYIVHTAEEITNEVKASEIETRLKETVESEQGLRSLVLQAPIGICVIDANTLVSKVVNEKFVDIAGKPIEEIIGNKYWDTFDDTRTVYEDALDHVVKYGHTFRANEVEIPRRRQGKTENVNVSFVYEPLKDEKGTVINVVVWVVDNTAQVTARKIVEESETYFRQLTEAAPVIIWITEKDGTCSYLNKNWYNYTGQTTEEANGFGWLNATHPDDRDEAAKIFFSANESQQPFSLLYRLRTNNGSYRWCKDNGSPKYSKDGAFDGFIGTVVDVHEEKTAEEKIRLSEERYRTLFNSIDAGFCTIDVLFDEAGKPVNYTFLEINKAFEQQTGLKNAVGKTMNDFARLENFWYETYGKVAVTGEAVRFENRAENLHRHYDVYAFKIGSANERKVGVLFTDITLRKETEQALTESEKRFRALVNASSDVIYSLNADWTIMNPLDGRGFLSDAYAPIKNWMEKNVHPEEFETVRKTIASAIANKSVFELEHRVITADGAVGWTFSKAIPLLDDDGNIIEWFGTASDITRRKIFEESLKQSESRFRSLADQSPMFVFIIEPDPVAHINYWNKTWLEYTGQSFAEASGRAWEDVIHPDDLPLILEIYLPAFQERRPYFIPAIRTRRFDGVYRWHAFKGNPRYSSDGSFLGYIGVGFDVHEQKITEEKLETLVSERTKELMRSNEDLQQFAHVASHDLKEPVRKVKTFISRLEQHLDGSIDETGERYIAKIHSAANRMSAMIDGVLTYSTLNSIIQKPQLVDLNEVIENIESDLEVVVQKTSAQFNYSGLPTIEGASVLLYQLFYNLVNNSIKFVREGISPEVKISSTTIEDNGRKFTRITFSDNGIGFENDLSDIIFDPFTRLNSKDKFEGTGLGLALCKKIVERHGGTISANGIPGGGATFIIVLPVSQNVESI